MTVMADRIGWSFRGAVGASIPFVCAVLGVVASNIPVSIFGALVPPPMFGLMPIYFWCLVRPDLMPPFAVFVIGVLQDLLSGGQAGVWTLSFVAAYAVVDRERDSFAGRAGMGAMLGFAAAMLVAGAIVCPPAHAENQSAPVLLQWFNGSYVTMQRRMPDYFMAVYGGLWTPPPGRADSGNTSVGYDVYDRFDLGSAANPTA